jgi:hypothetical protein
MTFVTSKEDIEKIRPYKENYELAIFPKRFPAFIQFNSHDGGLCGDYYTMDILEIPKKVKCYESFIMGVQMRDNAIKTYSESIFIKKK